MEIRRHKFRDRACLGIANVIGPSKTEGILARIELDGIMRFRLAGKGKQENTVMAERLFVAGNAVDVSGKYVVELLCGGEEGFEMNRVFLVPEYSWYVSLLAPLNDSFQLATQ